MGEGVPQRVELGASSLGHELGHSFRMDEDDFNDMRGLGRTWIEAGQEGARLAREDYAGGSSRGGYAPEGTTARGATANLGFTPNPTRESDLRTLHALCDDETLSTDGGLRAAEREAFESMRDTLESPTRKYETLTPKQREWAERRVDELGIMVVDPAERNRNVPRGREVESRAAQLGLPMTPPGRRQAELPAAAVGSDDIQGGDEGGPPASPLYARINSTTMEGARQEMAERRGSKDPEWPGDPCPDCGEFVKQNKSGLSCKNGHGFSDPHPLAEPAPAGKIGHFTDPQTITMSHGRPPPAGARRRPQPLGSRK